MVDWKSNRNLRLCYAEFGFSRSNGMGVPETIGKAGARSAPWIGDVRDPYKHARPHRGCRARTVKVGFKAYGFLVLKKLKNLKKSEF